MKFNLSTKLLTFLIVSILTFTATNTSKASHIMGGDINYVQLNDSVIGITMRIYEDCGGNISLDTSTLLTIRSSVCFSGDLTVPISLVNLNDVTPTCPANPSNCNNPSGLIGVREYIYYTTFQFPNTATPCSFNIRWSNCCRNGVITTLTTPNTEAFHIETDYLAISTFNNSSPIFTKRPLFYMCTNQTTNLNFEAYDPDGDDLVFSLTDCRTGLQLGDYVNYATGFSATNPMSASIFSLNAQTGQLTVSTNTTQVAVICVLVEEFRNGVKLGETIRDIQVIVTNCSNTPPIASGINGTASATGITGSYAMDACLGQPLCFDFEIFDVNMNSVGVEYLGIDTTVSLTIDTTQSPAKATICWTPNLSLGYLHPIPIRVFDDVCPIVGEAFFIYEINLKPFDATIDSTSLGPIFSGNSITLTTSSTDTACQYTWSPSATLSCTNCPNPTATPTSTTTYYATINCGSNCTGVDSVTVEVYPVSTQQIQDLNNLYLFPNPSNGIATLQYDLSKTSDITIEVYDILGRKLSQIVNEQQTKGAYQYTLNTASMKDSGLYFINIVVDNQVMTKKWMVLK